LNIKRYSFAIKEKYGSLLSLAVISAHGEDALEFLQGQFSQDLKRLNSGRVAYGFWLNQKGKVMGDAWVQVNSPEACTIFSVSMTADELTERLEAYLIADDVELEDVTAEWQGWWIAGERVRDRVDEGVAGDDAAAWAVPGSWALGWFFAKTPPAWLDQSKCAHVDEWNRARLVAGWPDVPTDLGPGDLPQEGGFADTTISLNKGCYLGQEVMARISAMGRVRRKLMPVMGTGMAPAGDVTEIRQGEKVVGELRSRTSLPDGQWLGLAMMSLAKMQSERPIHLANAGELEILADGTS